MKAEVTDLSTYFPLLDEFEHGALLREAETPWLAVGEIAPYVAEAAERARGELPSLLPEGLVLQHRSLGHVETILYATRLVEVREALVVEGTGVVLGQGVVIEPGALIKSPAIIGTGTEIRHGAYLRGDVLTGERCTIGHDTEVKNSIFMNHSEAGHFAYVGDSILGSYVNLGAGTKLANLELRRADDKLHENFPPIFLRLAGKKIQTGLSKVSESSFSLWKPPYPGQKSRRKNQTLRFPSPLKNSLPQTSAGSAVKNYITISLTLQKSPRYSSSWLHSLQWLRR